MCKSLLDTLVKEIKGYETYIYGAGTYGCLIGKYLLDNKVSFKGFIDRDKEKQASKLLGKKIIPIERVKIANAKILISVMPVFSGSVCDEIVRDIIENGILERNIIRFSENWEWIKEVIYSVKKPESTLSRNSMLMNKYVGKRCFLVGNGPSLTINDLNNIKDEHVFGCNGIYQVLDKVSLNHFGYLFADGMFFRNHIKGIEDVLSLSNKCEYMFTSINNFIYDDYRDEIENLFFIFLVLDINNIWIETDIDRQICEGGTALFALAQIIIYMGFSEIYLLGVDFSFHTEIGKDGVLKINNSVKNHPDYIKQPSEGKYDVEQILKSWNCLKEYADNNSIKIFNATRGGKLEVFPRVNFDTLFF